MKICQNLFCELYIKEFAKNIISVYPDYKLIYPKIINIPDKGDFRLVLCIKGIILGIESQGDPYTKLQDRLVELADVFKCEIIICSTRTKGETVKAVEYLCENRGFSAIWTSTYQVESNHHLVNRIKGKQILELLQGLNII